MDLVLISKFNIRVDEVIRAEARYFWSDLTVGQNISMYDFLSRCMTLSRSLRDFGMKKDQYWSLQGFDSLSTLTLIVATWMNEAVAVPLNPGITGKHVKTYLDQIPLHGDLDPSRFSADFLLKPIEYSAATLFAVFKNLMETKKLRLLYLVQEHQGNQKQSFIAYLTLVIARVLVIAFMLLSNQIVGSYLWGCFMSVDS